MTTPTEQLPILDGEITGAMNFRDLGGLPAEGGVIRNGLVFRSAMMHHITDDGLAALAGRYGIRTVIDLRTDEELTDDGLSNFAPVGIRHHHVPISATTTLTPEERRDRIRAVLAGDVAWDNMYAGMAQEHGAAFRSIFEIMASADSLSLVFHCSGGRDRTGVTAGLLLSALGVSEDRVAADYARTGELLRPHSHHFAATASRYGFTPAEMTDLVAATLPEAMLGFLGFLTTEYGSPRAYLESIGVGDDIVAELRSRLIAA